MPDRKPRILFFAPTDRLRSPVADYARAYAGVLDELEDFTCRTILGADVPELLPEGHGYVAGLRRRVAALMGPAEPDREILHAEISLMGQREFWAAHEAAHAHPRAPLCLTIHDSPRLTLPMPRSRQVGKGGRFDRWLTGVSHSFSLWAHGNLERGLLSRASVLLTLSRGAAGVLGGAYPSYYGKVACLPPVTVGGAGARPRAESNPSDPVRVTLYSLLGPGRGVEEVIEAVAMVHRRRPLAGRATMRVCGPVIAAAAKASAWENSVEDMIEEHNINRLVRLRPGWMGDGDLTNLLLQTDILVLCDPTFTSTGGAAVALMRAQALGAVVVVNSSGAAADMISSGRDGFAFPSGDPAGLADLLGRLIGARDQREQIAENLRGRAARERTPQAVALLVGDLYREVLQAQRERRPVRIPSEMLPEEGTGDA